MPMFDRMRGSSSSKPMRTLTVAFCRSAVGTMLMTWLGMTQSGYASSVASVFCPACTRLMKRLVDVDLDLARVHVDERRDAGAREAAAGRDRRDHLAGLRVLRDDDARERRAHLEVLDLLRAHAHGGFGDVDGALERREPRLRAPPPRTALGRRRARCSSSRVRSRSSRRSSRSASARRTTTSASSARVASSCVSASVELRAQRLIVELREQLAFLDGHAFLDRARPRSCP